MNDSLPPDLRAFLAEWPATFRARYEVQALLGSGAMGVVLRALDRERSCPVAIKGIRRSASTAEDEGLRLRLRREMKLLRALDHPAIVGLLDAAFWPDGEALVMEWVDGRELEIPEDTWTPDESLAFMAQVADGLAHAHERKIIHRDLKPQNLLVIRDGSPKILDLGLARGFDEQERTRLTRTGMLLGTPAWLAPETLRGAPSCPRSDVFQLGLICLDLLAGRHHLERYARDEVFDGTMHRRLARGDGLPPGLHGELAALLRRSLAEEPEARPGAAAFRDSLRAFLAEDRAAFPHGTAPSSPAATLLLERDAPAATGELPQGAGPGKRRAPGTATRSLAPSTAPPAPAAASPAPRRPLAPALLLSAILIAGALFAFLGLGRAPAPIEITAMQIRPAWHAIELQLRTERPCRVRWTLHLDGQDALLSRGASATTTAEHELRLRALRPDTAYRLRLVLDDGEARPIPLRTERPRWTLPPRADRLGDAICLRWDGDAVGPLRWTLSRGERKLRSGGGDDHGRILVRDEEAPPEAGPWAWQLVDGAGKTHGQSPLGDPHLRSGIDRPLGGIQPFLPRTPLYHPVLLGDLLVDVNSNGRLYTASLAAYLAATGPVELGWLAPDPPRLLSTRSYYGPPALDGRGNIVVFRESPDTDGGPQRWLPDEAHPGRLKAVPTAPSPPLRGQAIHHFTREGRHHRFAWIEAPSGDMELLVESYPIDGGPPASCRTLLSKLLAPCPGWRALQDENPRRAEDDPLAPLILGRAEARLLFPPPTFQGWTWPILALPMSPRKDRSEAFAYIYLLLRYHLENDALRLETVTTFPGAGPQPGAAVVGDDLWVSAGHELISIPARGRPRQLFPDPEAGICFFAPPMADEGQPLVWHMDGVFYRSRGPCLPGFARSLRRRIGRIELDGPSYRLRSWSDERSVPIDPYLTKAQVSPLHTKDLALCVLDDDLLVWHKGPRSFVTLDHGLKDPTLALLPGPWAPLLALRSHRALRLRPLNLVAESPPGPLASRTKQRQIRLMVRDLDGPFEGFPLADR